MQQYICKQDCPGKILGSVVTMGEMQDKTAICIHRTYNHLDGLCSLPGFPKLSSSQPSDVSSHIPPARKLSLSTPNQAWSPLYMFL